MIVRAAIMFSNGEVIEGRDYTNISNIATKLSLSGEKIHGFITATGDFVLPDEAANIALLEGQVPGPIDELTPQDLWPRWD